MSELITVPVALGERSYDVIIGDGALETGMDRLGLLCPRRRAFVAADAAALAAHGDRLHAALNAAGLEPVVFEIEGGERAKSWAGVERLVEALLEAGIERSECLIAFGGGTIGDLAGFAAAVTKRGVGFVQIPRRFWPRSTARSAARPASTPPRARTSPARFTSLRS